VNAWLAVAAALLAGLGASRLLAGKAQASRPEQIVLWAVLASGLWLLLLDLVSVRWTWLTVLVPACVGVAIVAFAGRRRRWTSEGRGSAWVVATSAAVGARAAVLAPRPACGWDFRYNWGLKARVFALAGGHDGAWLSWPGHGFAHPDYPPLWPDLLAGAAALGADPATAAAAWTAVLAVGLAGACWLAAAPAPAPVRALAAVVGGWAPVIFAASTSTSGYAEPLLAFLTAVGVVGLARPEALGGGARVIVAGAVVGLALTKNEGGALALGMGLAAWARPAGRRDMVPMAAALLALGLWRGYLIAGGISGEALLLDWARSLGRLADFPAALAATVGPGLIVVGALWVAAGMTVRGREAQPVWIALAVWALAVLGAYLVSPHDLGWHVSTSLERVLAVPLPALVALGLGQVWGAQEGGGGMGTKQPGRRRSSSRP